MAPQYIPNVTLQEAQAIRRDFEKLRNSVKFDFSRKRLGSILPDSVDAILLFDRCQLVYDPDNQVLALKYDGKNYGFDDAHGADIQGLHAAINDYLAEIRNPNKNNFKTKF